jgi:predicted oxidoreductase
MDKADVVIAGGGLAGIVCAFELLNRGKRVLLIDKDAPAKFGGLAKESFGGIHMIGTPQQWKLGFRDSTDKAYRDWQVCAFFGEGDRWPREWARYYCENSREQIYDYLTDKDIKFLPMVMWAERGYEQKFNSVPRWHIVWGTGHEIVRLLTHQLDAHPHRRDLEIWFEHEVSAFEQTNGRVTGVRGKRMVDGAEYQVRAEHVVVATGGICGGDLSKLRANWLEGWGAPPKIILNGAHMYADGMLHDRVEELGGNVTHLNRQWHYPAGVHHPSRRRPNDGLSLVPPRSAVWLNALGERIGPPPLVPYTDTRKSVEAIVNQPGQYSWQVLNWKIALKELAVSGGDYMTAYRYKSRIKLLKHLLFGNRGLIKRLIFECPDDFVVANDLQELAAKMNEHSLFDLRVDAERMREEIEAHDRRIDEGPLQSDDEQLLWIAKFREYPGDRLRTCDFQKILDPKARPLIAIREFILSRKSLGGIQTDLHCRVLAHSGEPIPGLYAVGEAAGFGGGGIHGVGSLEGTFLGSCVLTAQAAARAIAEA